MTVVIDRKLRSVLSSSPVVVASFEGCEVSARRAAVDVLAGSSAGDVRLVDSVSVVVEDAERTIVVVAFSPVVKPRQRGQLLLGAFGSPPSVEARISLPRHRWVSVGAAGFVECYQAVGAEGVVAAGGSWRAVLPDVDPEEVVVTCPFGSWVAESVQSGFESLSALVMARVLYSGVRLRYRSDDGESLWLELTIDASSRPSEKPSLTIMRWTLTSPAIDVGFSERCRDVVLSLPSVVYAFAGVSTVFDRRYNPRPIDGWKPEDRSNVRPVLDEFGLDAFPWQLLNAAHAARIGAGIDHLDVRDHRRGSATAAGVEVTLGEPEEWFDAAMREDSERLDTLVVEGRAALGTLLVDDSMPYQVARMAQAVKERKAKLAEAAGADPTPADPTPADPSAADPGAADPSAADPSAAGLRRGSPATPSAQGRKDGPVAAALRWAVVSECSDTLLLADDVAVVVNAESLDAVSLDDGSLVWSRSVPVGIGAARVDPDARVVVCDTLDDEVVCFSLRSGDDTDPVAPGSTPPDGTDLAPVLPEGYTYREGELAIDGVTILTGCSPDELPSVARVGSLTVVNDFDRGLVVVTDDGEILLSAGTDSPRECDPSPIVVRGHDALALAADGHLRFLTLTG